MRLQYTNVNGYKRAVVSVEFLSDDGRWLPVDMVVDTAADISVLPYSFAMQLRFVDIQMPILAREVVGSVPALYTSVRARLDGREFTLPIITSAFIDEPLLGMTGFIDNFIVKLYPNSFEVISV
jgi:predicted aspartyl protease